MNAADHNAYPCAECGHLHYGGPKIGYVPCPLDGCDCQGQDEKGHPVPNTVRGVRLKYAYEDAINLADDLSTSGDFDLATRAREIAAELLLRRSTGEGPDAAGTLLHSVKV